MDKDKQVVFSAGDSWIICRSKSHSGRIYYFNTLTGEAAWNLSSAEIEKAKTRTKTLSKQANINIEACPEPKEPPTDQTEEMSGDHQDTPTTSRIYNKQIINNQFPKPSYSMAPVLIPPFNQLVANQLNNLMPLAMNPGYSPNVWALPSTHQIFIGSTISPVVNQEQSTDVNIAYGNQQHTIREPDTSTSLTEGLKYVRSREYSSPKTYERRPKFTTPKSNKRNNQKNKYQKMNHQSNYRNNFGVQDLRQVLSAKKREQKASFSFEHEGNAECNVKNGADITEKTDDYLSSCISGSEVNINNEEGHKKKDEGNKTDSDWIEDNILIEGSRFKLNLTNLKKMAKPETNLKRWYIMADKDMLLYHLYFLNTLCISDDSCCLMVAQKVLAELRELSRGNPAALDTRRARRAASFFLKRLDEGCAVIGDGTCGENDTRCDYLLNCCSNLSENNFHVVILSNDDEFKSHKNGTNIPIFDIKQIKRLLTYSESEIYQPNKIKQAAKTKCTEIKKTDRLKPPPCMTKSMPKTRSLEKGPKITVTNDLVLNNDENLNASEVNKKTQCNWDVATVDECNEDLLKKSDKDNQSHKSIKPPNYTVKAAAKTDSLMTKPILHYPNASMEITVSNDLVHKISEDFNVCGVNKETQCNMDLTVHECNETLLEKCEKSNHLHKFITPIKYTVEAAVQTDSDITKPVLQIPKQPVAYDLVQNNDEYLIACEVNKETQCDWDIVPVDECNEGVFEKSDKDNDLHKSITPAKDTVEDAVKTESQNKNGPSMPIEIIKQEIDKNEHMPAKTVRKEIRLNRSILDKTTTSNEDAGAEKKQFKWRRRRNAGTANDSNMSSVNSLNVDTNSEDSANPQHTTSIEIPHKNSDDSICSEMNSLVNIRNQFNKSLIIEETSTSGIISNSTIDSESEIGNKLYSSMLSNPKQKIEPSKTVMYKITDQVMEDSLRIMNDEWISRYTQIMEEVLMQVLRKDEQFLVDVVYKLHGGGPWTIWEAADCIKIKFSDDWDIVDAAKKLINFFEGISDHTGKIQSNLEPSAYMEMYSFGVYLVRSLEHAQCGCDDVGGAARALQTLLDDIRSSNRDASTHDAFSDNNSTDALTNTSTPKPARKLMDEQIYSVKPLKKLPKSKSAPDVNSSRNVVNKTYNLRSRNKPQELRGQENKVKNVKLTDSKKSVESKSAVTKLISSPQPFSDESELASSSQGLVRSMLDRNQDDSRECYKNTTGTKAKAGTAVTRKITAFRECKKTLKQSVVREPLDTQLEHSATFDGEKNFTNAGNDEYYNGHCSQFTPDHVKVPRRGQNTDKNSDHNEDEFTIIQTSAENEFFITGNDKQFLRDSPLNINVKLNTIFGMILRRVKEALLDVEKFCKETYRQFRESRAQAIKRKYEIKESAGKTQVLLDNLCTSLNGILHREESGKNIQSLLKEAGIDDSNLDHNLLNRYRCMVGKCLEQAKILQDSVALILSVTKKL